MKKKGSVERQAPELAGGLLIAVAAGIGLLAACGGGGGDSAGGGAGSGGGLGPLQDFVTIGAKNDWMHSLESGTYRMENRGDPNNVRYFHVPSPEEHHGSRSVEVRVQVEGSAEQSRAGLIYGLRHEPRRYFAIVTDGRGMLEVYQRDANGLRMTMGSSIEATTDGVTRIQVEEDGRELTIRGNGRSIGSIENAGTGTGSTGILAMGPGSFSFTDFRISPEIPSGPVAGRVPSREMQGGVRPALDANAERPEERGEVFWEVGSRASSGPSPDGSGGRAMPQLRMPDIRYHPVRDRTQGRTNGMIIMHVPIPADWVVNENPNASVVMQGPGGIRVHGDEIHQFGWSPDPNARESLARLGQQLAPVASLEQILEQQIRPSEAARGNRLVRTHPVPAVESFWNRYEAGVTQTGSRRHVRALGTEWTDGRGTMSFLSIVQFVIEKHGMIHWTLRTGRVEAPAKLFADAKAAALYSAATTRFNPQWMAAANGQMIANIKSHEQMVNEMMEQSGRAHQQRMAAIQARGSTARSVGQINSDILDISHQGFLKRDDINTAGHQNLINTTLERSVIGNHETGEHYNVPAGADHYWVRNDGYYMGTDNPNLDPNLDPRLYQFEWTRFPVEQ